MIKLSDMKDMQRYRAVHIKTGLFFNDYIVDYSRDQKMNPKNTLSKTHSKIFFAKKTATKEELLEIVFEGKKVNIENVSCIRNIIVYSGSEIHEILSKHYEKYDWIPISDFEIQIVK